MLKTNKSLHRLLATVIYPSVLGLAQPLDQLRVDLTRLEELLHQLGFLL